jgi:hypothetical protein
MHANIKRFGKLVDDGDSGDEKATFIGGDLDDGWKCIRIEIDTDDCDRKHAKAFKSALIELWNKQGASNTNPHAESADAQE